jgi:hypothetical protein
MTFSGTKERFAVCKAADSTGEIPGILFWDVSPEISLPSFAPAVSDYIARGRFGLLGRS